jgi:hypothetical protein
MITNKGKNIIAKYLIGDAPAYASYLALGCGSKPRPNINEKTNVSTGTLTGTILSTGAPAVDGKFITPVIFSPTPGLSKTSGLVVGMVLTKTVSGEGAFGDDTTIISIDGPNRITVSSSVGQHTAGPITFNTKGPAQLLEVSSTDGLWIGAKIVLTGGTGTLAPLQETIVTAINPSTNLITITPGPTVNLLGATLSIEIDPRKESLDFEMFRVPISSRGYVNDDGVNKIVLTAQLPTEERYEITEVGVYSSGSNAIAGQYDSKTITAFSADENWQLSIGDSLFAPSVTSAQFPEFQLKATDTFNNITTTASAFKTSTTNGLFTNSVRSNRYERPRFLSNVLLLKSNSSEIFTTLLNENSLLEIQEGSDSLQLNGATVDLSKNSISDIMKVAFSIVSISGGSEDIAPVPDFARVVVEFANANGSQVAQMQINASNDKLDFFKNRYVVAQKRLDELSYSVGGQFSWRDVSVIRIYASAIDRLSVTNKAADGELYRGTPDSVLVTSIDSPTSISYRVTGGLSPVPGTVLNPERISGSSLILGEGATVQDVVRVGTTDVWNAKLTGLAPASVLELDVEDEITADPSSVAIITTSSSHNLVAGDRVSMFEVDSDLNGAWQVSEVINTTSFKIETTKSVLTGAVNPNGTLDVASKEYFIALDALRLDNVSTPNPLYGLTGYSIIQNIDELAIVKSSNTNNYVEYRFILDVT